MKSWLLLLCGFTVHAAILPEDRFLSTANCAQFLAEQGDGLRLRRGHTRTSQDGSPVFGGGKHQYFQRQAFLQWAIAPTLKQIAAGMATAEQNEEGDQLLLALTYAQYVLNYLERLLEEINSFETNQRKSDRTFVLTPEHERTLARRLVLNLERNVAVRQDTIVRNDLSGTAASFPLLPRDAVPEEPDFPEQLLTEEDHVDLMSQVAALLRNHGTREHARRVLIAMELAANHLKLPLIRWAFDYVAESAAYVRLWP